jgi:hypothetical protein
MVELEWWSWNSCDAMIQLIVIPGHRTMEMVGCGKGYCWTVELEQWSWTACYFVIQLAVILGPLIGWLEVIQQILWAVAMNTVGYMVARYPRYDGYGGLWQWEQWWCDTVILLAVIPAWQSIVWLAGSDTMDTSGL